LVHLREDLGGAAVQLSASLKARLDALFDPAAVQGARYSCSSAAEVDTEEF
jgi:hypothetical protein